MGVKKLFEEGHKGCIVTTDRNAKIKPLFLADVEDESGKIPPRMVDIKNEFSQLVLSDMHVLTPADYNRAWAYLPNPEDFDFYKILNWKYTPAKEFRRG